MNHPRLELTEDDYLILARQTGLPRDHFATRNNSVDRNPAPRRLDTAAVEQPLEFNLGLLDRNP
jgi:hypothetical protein